MDKEKKKQKKTSLFTAIIGFFLVFFVILYFIFQPREAEEFVIPLIIGLSLAYLFGIWLVSQE